MKKEIKSTKEIELLVNAFYEKVRSDEQLGHIFDKVAGVHWESHLPKMYRFWDSILFGTARYKGNPMIKHIDLNRKFKVEQAHFDHWLALFHSTVDELFEGEMADEAKQRASSIAYLMQMKIRQSETKDIQEVG